MQQFAQPKSSNGYGRRKVERDAASRHDNKSQTGKTNSSRTSIGIVLKMAQVIKDGSRVQQNASDTPNKPPARTFIVPAKDLVQVIAKGVPVTRDGLTNEPQNEKQQELMTDSCISQSRHVEVGRELEPWVPDENDPVCSEMENIFDDPWNRGWDQFEANAALFGVKSTFNEELYTTKLEKGPQMRDLEKEAARLAREIEGEETLDLHLAEERGIQLDESLEMDEETRFSSVFRRVDDSGYAEIENILLDARNAETFGGVSSSIIGKPPIDMNSGKTSVGTQASSRSSLMGEMHSFPTSMNRGAYHLGSEDHNQKLFSKHLSKQSINDETRYYDSQSIGRAENSCAKEDNEKSVLDQSQPSKAEDSNSLLRLNNESPDKVVLSPNATSFDPSHAPSKGQENVSSSNDLSEDAIPPKAHGTASSLARLGSSASSTSDCGGPTSTSAGRGLSPSSSVCSLTSEKSSLNPHAKEFKFNPNAKSFVPIQTPPRPSSPVADSSYYYPANVASQTQMHGMSVGIGMGPSFPPHQPEKENLCLYGFPSEQWEVNLPAEEVPPELPEPALGINFARDGMAEKDWISLVAVHSDTWLLAVAFYFGARFRFDKSDRKRLFNMINDLPTVYEVVTGAAKKQQKEKLAVSNHSNSKSKSNSKSRTPEIQPNIPKPQLKEDEDVMDEEDEEEEEEEDEHGDTLCGACGENYASDDDTFWICCDICEKWFHGKCVKITPARAEHIKQYKCPSCSNKRARP